MRDYYGDRGCCLTCVAPEEMEGHRWDRRGCLCFECKCRSCEQYDEYAKCTYQQGDVIVWSDRQVARSEGEGG